jgi:NAD(P)H-hydrate epimerase
LNDKEDVMVHSTITFTFHAPKLTFLFPGNAAFVPDFRVLDIGLSREYAESLTSTYIYVDATHVKGLIKKRGKFSHKGTYGHALICAGSFGKMGAAVLSTAAALRSGAGLVSAHIPHCGYNIMQTTNPEAMVIADEHENHITQLLDYTKFTAIGIGPGIGRETKTVDFIEKFLRKASVPLVIDADALNIISAYHYLRDLLPHGSIFTPHPGEFKRLVGEWKDDIDKLNRQIAFSKQYKVVIVLKGANTSVSTPLGKVYFNSTGNPGMAKGGSGDVLTGIISALLAQKYEPEIAAVIGVYIHGAAGDLAALDSGITGMDAMDIVRHLPRAFAQFEK